MQLGELPPGPAPPGPGRVTPYNHSRDAPARPVPRAELGSPTLTCRRVREDMLPLHMAVRVTAMASGTSKTAMAAFRMPGYRCSVYLAMLSRSPAGSGKCCASNCWYHRYTEWKPSFPSSSYLQALTSQSPRRSTIPSQLRPSGRQWWVGRGHFPQTLKVHRDRSLTTQHEVIRESPDACLHPKLQKDQRDHSGQYVRAGVRQSRCELSRQATCAAPASQGSLSLWAARWQLH